jgi:hypothetical protein
MGETDLEFLTYLLFGCEDGDGFPLNISPISTYSMALCPRIYNPSALSADVCCVLNPAYPIYKI